LTARLAAVWRLASLAELELELGGERRTAARDARRARSQSMCRPKALDDSRTALARRMNARGETRVLAVADE
jgi:DNA invertase Pin-like site-specific DNA recombinase